MNLQVWWNRHAYAIVDVDAGGPEGRTIVRDNMWERGWARADEDFGGNADAYVIDLHKNAIIEYVKSGLTPHDGTLVLREGSSTVPALKIDPEGAERFFTINVHLGKGAEGARRMYALRSLAGEAGYYWNGEPSVGRWLSALADERMGPDWRPRSVPDLKARLRTLSREQIQMWQALLAELGQHCEKG